MFGRPFSGIEQPSIDLNNNNESDYDAIVSAFLSGIAIASGHFVK
jgi:hypothetical protein